MPSFMPEKDVDVLNDYGNRIADFTRKHLEEPEKRFGSITFDDGACFNVTEYPGRNAKRKWVYSLNLWHPTRKGFYIPFVFEETASDIDTNVLHISRGLYTTWWGDGDRGGSEAKEGFEIDPRLLSSLDRDVEEGELFSFVAKVAYFIWATDLGYGEYNSNLWLEINKRE